MNCEYDDGIKLNYSGSLRIKRGDEVIYVKKSVIPANVMGDLQSAARRNNCVELRQAACKLTDTIPCTS